MLPEHIRTIKSSNQISLKEKGSEFIAIVFPVDNEETALNRLNEIRKKYFNATHHCYAYRIKSGGQKYSDDGEPNGTAGVRILTGIEHFDLTDLLVIVVRYFGGTKLGVGPLGKAYYNASLEVLEHTEKIDQTLYREIGIVTEYNFISQVHRIINQYSAIISDSQFTNKAEFKCLVKPNDFEHISFELTNLTNGQILITPKNNFSYL